MTESETESPTSEPPRTGSALLRKFAFTMVLLVGFWFIFTQILPGLLFKYRNQPAERQRAAENSPPPAANSNIAPQPTVTDGRIEQLEARIKALEDMITAMPKTEESSAATDDKIAAMQAQIDAIPQDAPPAIDDERIANIEARLAEQDKVLINLQSGFGQAQSEGARQLGIMSAFAQLQDIIRRGENFNAAWLRLKSLTASNAPAQELLAQLEPYAQTQPATLQTLKDEFGKATEQALAPEVAKGSFMDNVHSLIRIRKIGEHQQGKNDEAVLARAEAKLAREDIEGALTELTGLSPDATAVFVPWVQQAQAYLRVRQIAGMLQPALLPDVSVPPKP